LNYEVIDYQVVSVVVNDVTTQTLAVKIRYYDTDFENITILELPGTSTDANVQDEIIKRGSELKQQVKKTWSFSQKGTI
jgi:hypothetical protein